MKLLRRYWKRLLLLIFVMLVVAGVGFFVWGNTPAGELMPQALTALESNDTVTVSRDNWLVFEPVSGTANTGFIFYPGGRVLADAYAPLGQGVAETGYLAVFVPMPLNLAVFDVDAANRVIEAYPDISYWVIAGHSLGGAMAARYAYNNPDAVDGLVMLAAFPETQFDFSQRDIVVASIYGELDGLATVEEVESSFSLLPDDSLHILIEGGNHAQFGWYGEQAGDNPASIPYEAQFEKVLTTVLQVLEQVSNR